MDAFPLTVTVQQSDKNRENQIKPAQRSTPAREMIEIVIKVFITRTGHKPECKSHLRLSFLEGSMARTTL